MQTPAEIPPAAAAAAEAPAVPRSDDPPAASDPSSPPPPPPPVAVAAATADPPPPAQPQGQKTVTWSEKLTSESPTYVAAATAEAAESSQYVSRGPASSSSKGAVEAMKETLSRWGKSVGETTKMVESLSRDTWQHCEISEPTSALPILPEPSFFLFHCLQDSFLEVHGLRRVGTRPFWLCNDRRKECGSR